MTWIGIWKKHIRKQKSESAKNNLVAPFHKYLNSTYHCINELLLGRAPKYHMKTFVFSDPAVRGIKPLFD
ncbi:MAG: hypothetical protein OEX02_12655 [Cyclobacteriaceae bacterium]|nr:hypothetical protein [Cyclobacteriaceae bacterium]